jgi:hypothetical protein
VRINGIFLDAKNFKGKGVGCTTEQLCELLFADVAEIVAIFPKDLSHSLRLQRLLDRRCRSKS